jgi:hypothetical protein
MISLVCFEHTEILWQLRPPWQFLCPSGLNKNRLTNLARTVIPTVFGLSTNLSVTPGTRSKVCPLKPMTPDLLKAWHNWFTIKCPNRQPEPFWSHQGVSESVFRSHQLWAFHHGAFPAVFTAFRATFDPLSLIRRVYHTSGPPGCFPRVMSPYFGRVMAR